MTCSYSKEYSKSAFTDVENSFIFEYMPTADGDAVKVYLYGLFLCKNAQYNQSISDISKTLNLPEEKIVEFFTFWEEMGLVSILEKEPLNVEYLPVRPSYNVKARKYKTEKYSEFTKAIQVLLSARMISTNEYAEYFNVMETYGIKPDAMTMIVKYCIDLKGNDIGQKYILKVAKDFGNRGLVTVEKIEKELSSYLLRMSELQKILSALSLKRVPDIDDQNYYKKWTKELNFEPENILVAAKVLKKGNMEKLDNFLLELYSQKSFTKEEILGHAEKQRSVYDLAIKINKALGVYVEVISTVVDNYTNKWISYGFDDQTLLLIATQCFRTGKKDLQSMNDLIEDLRKIGCIDLTSVSDNFEREKKVDLFITKLLATAGVNRRPNQWDRDNLQMWKNWNFTEDMILEAGKLASGKNSPMAYVNSILSSWKNNGIYTKSNTMESANANQKITPESYNSEYAKRRNYAVSKAQQNVEKAMELPGFNTLYERVFSIEKDLAFAEISGNDELINTLEKEKLELQSKIDKLLSSIGLTSDDLSPKYRCPKCNDTGYVGDKKCDCFDK